LRLGGAANSAFNASALGTQYLGFASVEKSGASAWTVTGSTNAPAPWSIDQGALIVNGSIARATLTTVNSGATLAGAGGVGNLLVAGTFAPGPAPGIMTVAGNLAFQPASTYSVQLAGMYGSRAEVSGAASLNGTLVTAFVPGAGLTRSYDVLHADGGLGSTRFAAFDDPPSFIESLSYGPNDIFVDLTAVLGAGAALPVNQQSVANALNGYFNAGGLLPGNFVVLYGLTGSALSNALALASGEATTGAQESAFQSTDLFIEAMLDPTAAGRSASADALALGAELPTQKNAQSVFEPRWTSWAASFGGDGRIDGDPTGTGSHDLSANAFGVAAGLDYHLTRDSLVGAALGGGRTSWALSQGLGGGAGDLFDLGVYASTRVGPAYGSGALAFSNQWMRTSRADPSGDLLSADFISQTYGGRIESGYRLATPAGGLTPYAALEAMDFTEPSHRENDCCGGGFGLAYAGRTASDIRSEFGARFDDVVAVQSDATLMLRARLAWIHDWVSDPTVGATFETLPGASFNVVGAIPAKNAALLSGGAEVRLAGGATFGARFDGELASRAHAYAGTVFLRVSF
jgi:outer membrane autotransporter protein